MNTPNRPINTVAATSEPRPLGSGRSSFLNYLILLIPLILPLFPLLAAEQHGFVKFGGLPLPGATVTASQAEKKLIAITDQQGVYSFADLPDGVWTIQVEMLCFVPIKQNITIAA